MDTLHIYNHLQSNVEVAFHEIHTYFAHQLAPIFAMVMRFFNRGAASKSQDRGHRGRVGRGVSECQGPPEKVWTNI